jgi:hypothetical protein
MDSIYLKAPVTVKAKLTEKLKTRMLNDMDEAIKRAELEVQQLNIQEKRVLDENKPANPDVPTPDEINRIGAIQQQFGQEKQKRLQYRQETMSKREELDGLAIGAEIVQGTLERQVEVKVGDDMREIMNVEILVEDDKIVAIRG